MESLVAARVFKRLPEGIRLLGLLAQEELNGNELHQILEAPQATLSRRLNVMKEAGLVQSWREGNHSSYFLDHPPVDAGGGSG